ncbi:MAG: RNA polymerase sigma factor [Candidatus Lambdaproteobacteria bacterium]|nr:RNA polymerase sigma factor [Candidatus Lambdaproteobacteria bacterium]
MAQNEWEGIARRLQSGDAQAFEELVRQHHAPVFRLARRLLHNVEDAKEVTQESFLAAYEGLGGFRGQSSPLSWLMSITYNKSVDRLKRNRRFEEVSEDDFESSEKWQRVALVGKITDRPRNPEQTLLDGQLRAHLETALRRVPPDSRAVFELRELQGLSGREVASALNISEAAVRVRLHRVRQYLMTALQPVFDRDE